MQLTTGLRPPIDTTLGSDQANCLIQHKKGFKSGTF